MNISFNNDNESYYDSIAGIKAQNQKQNQLQEVEHLNYTSQLKSPKDDFLGKQISLRDRNMNIHFSERSETEAQVESEIDDDSMAAKKRFGDEEEIGMSKKRKK